MNQQGTLARPHVHGAFLWLHSGFALADNDRLFAKRLIDSMGVTELIGALQSAFGLAVSDDDVTEQNLGAVADTARFTAAKRGNGAR